MKNSSKKKDTIRKNYDFSEGVRGKYSEKFTEGSNVIILDPDVASLFPDSESVNKALRAIASVAPVQKRAEKTGT